MTETNKIVSADVVLFPWDTKESVQLGSSIPKDFEGKAIKPVDVTSKVNGKVITSKFSSTKHVNSKISYNNLVQRNFGREGILSISVGSAINYRNSEERRLQTERLSKKTINNSFTTIRHDESTGNLYPEKKYNNGFVSHAIPSSVYGFKWISDHSYPSYYNGGNEIQKPQGELLDNRDFTGIEVNFITSSFDNNKAGDTEIDIAGTNALFYEPSSLMSLTSGPKSLSSSGVSPSNYSKYLTNKKGLQFRARGTSFWTKDQNSIVRNLNEKNLYTITKRSAGQESTSFFRSSPVSQNNVSRINFVTPEGQEFYVETLMSNEIVNKRFSENFRTEASVKRKITEEHNNAIDRIVASGYDVSSIETREIVFPNRENMSLSFVKRRGNFSDTEFEKSKKTTDLRFFWNEEAENRIRPVGSSNSLDYKNSNHYNSKQSILDSVFALDNMVMNNGKRLTGELSYQGEDFYKNLITRVYASRENLQESSISDYDSQIETLESQDALKLDIVVDRTLEKHLAKRSLANAVDFDKNYGWGTSISPLDLHKNFKYYSGTFYDKSRFKIDYKAQDDSAKYDNKTMIINSYTKTKESLLSFGIELDSESQKVSGLTFPVHQDGDNDVSQENPSVLFNKVPRKSFTKLPITQFSNTVGKNSSRPTMQLSYHANEFYGKEKGFSPEISRETQPFYSNFGDLDRGINTSSPFGSLISEFNMSKNIDEYLSRDTGIEGQNLKFLSVPGSGEKEDLFPSDTSRKIIADVTKIFSFDGAGINKIKTYPESDNNYAWYSSRNRDNRLKENKTFKGRNILIIPDDSTYSLENSVNTEYNIVATNGINGLSESSASWYSYENEVKKNAAAQFNVEDLKKDYLKVVIDKFSETKENIDLTDTANDAFSVSLWFQPNKEWHVAEDEVGLFSLTNNLGDFSQYISVYSKGTSGGLSVKTNIGNGAVNNTSVKAEADRINNLVFSYDAGQFTVYLNGSQVAGLTNVSISNVSSMSIINSLLFGISNTESSYVKYRGIIDEIYLFNGQPSSSDISKIYSGGKPSNLIEFWANEELEQITPVFYGRVGYPFAEDIKQFNETHDTRFMDNYVFGSDTRASSIPSEIPVSGYSVSLSGINKILPYNGLYPYQRVMQAGEVFEKTYKTNTLLQADKLLSYSQTIQSLLQPFFAPGVVFNTIKSGIECPWPIYTNATGLEPSVSYGDVKTFIDVGDETKEINRIYDNLAPSWFYDDVYQCEDREFLDKRPETLRELENTRSHKELVKSQPKFANKFNASSGLLIARPSNSKISLDSLKEESFYETIKSMEQENLKKVKAYQYCILEFTSEDIEENSGFSLYIPGRDENLNVTFRKSENLDASGEKYAINKNNSSFDAQIEIESYEFNTRNIEKSVCSLLNLHLETGEYRAVSLNRTDEDIVNPEEYVMNNLDLGQIDERLDTAGDEKVRLAFVYIGIDSGHGIENRLFSHYDKAKVSTFSGDKSESLGITYRDEFNGAERNINLNIVPYGQYDKPLYSGKDIVISLVSGKNIDSKGVERKEEQIFFLAGDHYTGTPLDIKQDYVWPSFTWKKSLPDSRFQKTIENFSNESQEFFLKHDKPLHYVANNKVVKTVPGKTYTMEVFMRKTDNFSVFKSFKNNEGKYFGCPYKFQATNLYRDESQLVDDLAFAPFAPAYHYGDVSAKLSFTADKSETTVDEIINSLTIEHYSRGMENQYKTRFKNNGTRGFKSFLESASYRGRNSLDSCVDFLGTNSEGHWEISLKSEFPMLNYEEHVANSETPKGFLYNYGKIPSAKEGVYFGVRKTVEQELGVKEDCLIELCGFMDPQSKKPIKKVTENRIGELADKKIVKEAVLVIPYTSGDRKNNITEATTKEGFVVRKEDQDVTLNFFDINRDLYNKVSAGEIESESILRMKNKLENFVLPPELDFINDSAKDPFVCYVLESEVSLNSKDLADIWQGRLPSKSKAVMSIEDSTNNSVFEHPAGKNEFFSGKKIPEDTRFMVFKVKEKSLSSQQEVLSYNWPYDYFSIIEKGKIEFKTVMES